MSKGEDGVKPFHGDMHGHACTFCGHNLARHSHVGERVRCLDCLPDSCEDDGVRWRQGW